LPQQASPSQRSHRLQQTIRQSLTVRGLAVTSLERSPYFPYLPSVHETVVPNFLIETWNGIKAPAKTPEPVIRRLAEVLIKMADDPRG
jgi:tripartite-type tricarboxylate transporter receptor subunit TctC